VSKNGIQNVITLGNTILLFKNGGVRGGASEEKFNKETEGYKEREKSVMFNGRAEFRMRAI
jgi:hypothetical protein